MRKSKKRKEPIKKTREKQQSDSSVEERVVERGRKKREKVRDSRQRERGPLSFWSIGSASFSNAKVALSSLSLKNADSLTLSPGVYAYGGF